MGLRWISLRGGVVALVAALGLPAVGTGLAAAAPQPVPASISSVLAKGGTVSGVLTVRGADAQSLSALKATMGGQPAAIKVQPVTRGRRAVILVVDTSGSMGQAGMETVRKATAVFLKDAPQDVFIGLVSFAGTAGVDVPLTKDRGRVQKAVNGLRSRGETSLYDGVASAVTALGSSGDRSIILLSDGGDTRSRKNTQASATAALRKSGVRAEVIGFKTDESDNSALRGFAAAGGGSVAAAGDSAAVQAAFAAAARVLESQVTFEVTPPAGMTAAQTLTVNGFAAGRPFKASAEVRLGASSPSPAATADPASLIGADDESAAPPVLKSSFSITTPLLLAMAGVFLGLLVLGISLAPVSFRTERQRRVDTLEQYVSGAALVERASSARPSAISAQLVQFGDKVMDNRESTTKTMRLIDRADLPLRAGEWWVLRVLSVVLFAMVGWAVLHGGVLATLAGVSIGATLGFVVPSLVLRFLAKRRSRKFERQLPGLFMLAASSLSTGFSLPQAFDAVAKDAPQPAGKEFSRTLAETRIGLDIADSLEKMAARMDSDNMRWTAMAIRIQREVGGNLAETLRTTAKTLREREELHRTVRALSAEGRLSSYILVSLPVGLFLYMLKVNYDYISLLWTTPIGWAMSIGATVMVGIGALWMKKVVEVEV